MPFTPEQTTRLAEIQRAVLAKTHTREMLAEAVAIMRQDRVGAQAASTTAKTKKAAEAKVINPAAVLADLKSLAGKLNAGGSA